MQRRHHQVEGETKARAKNGVPLPPDGFSFANLFLEPLLPTVFYPPTFCLPPETEPHSSVCTFFYSYVFRLGLQSILHSFICCSLVNLRAILQECPLPLCYRFYGWYRVSAVCFVWLWGVLSAPVFYSYIYGFYFDQSLYLLLFG